jgi:hypothetical protein
MTRDRVPLAQTKQIDLGVHYHGAYLADGEDFWDRWQAGPPIRSAGIIQDEGSFVGLHTGLHTGIVDFTVTVADCDPGSDLDGYEDVVEISYEFSSDLISLVEWGDEAIHHLPPLPAGPGTYRLRYHARGMDEANARDTSDVAIDHYLLQIWPAPSYDPAVLKSRSSYLRDQLSVE